VYSIKLGGEEFGSRSYS